MHKTANVLDALPKSAPPAVKHAVRKTCNGEDKERAAKAVAAFARQCAAKYPKVIKRITDAGGELPVFFGFPAQHGSTCGPRTRSSRPGDRPARTLGA
ncbi:transposase-like protein [Streptomyces filamentosus]